MPLAAASREMLATKVLKSPPQAARGREWRGRGRGEGWRRERGAWAKTFLCKARQLIWAGLYHPYSFSERSTLRPRRWPVCLWLDEMVHCYSSVGCEGTTWRTALRSLPYLSVTATRMSQTQRFYPNAVRWLTFVTSHLGPAQAHGELELWDDRAIEGGGNWKKQIDEALSRCAVCILLVSRHSLTSRFILDVEMQKILERHHARGAHLYPIVITACDVDAAKWLMNLSLRPRDGTALELYSEGQRNAVMATLAREIRTLLDSVQSSPKTRANSFSQLIDVTRMPGTAYKKLVAES